MTKTAINTRTQEEYDALMGYCRSIGMNIPSERAWSDHRENTCIVLDYLDTGLNVGDLSYFKNKAFNIIPFTEFAKANIVEGTKCPNCNGDGYTAEHNPNDPHHNGECSGGCPIQVQCEHCMATGVIQEPDYKALYLEGRELLEKAKDTIEYLMERGNIASSISKYDVRKIEAYLTKHKDGE